MKKQTIISSFVKRDWIFFLLLFLTLASSFVLLIPKLTTTLIPQKRVALLQNFIQTTQTRQEIDLQHYWEFREFYSPGSFIYEKTGLPADEHPALLSLKKIDTSATPQLLFTSQRIISIGGRTKNKTLVSEDTTNKHIITKTPSVVLSEDATTFYLVFLKPISQIRNANGFLQNEPVHDEIRGDMWIEQTTIQK